MVSLAISKTGTWTKIRADSQSCLEEQRPIDVMVFVTAGNPQTKTIEKWRADTKEQFGWDLEVRALRWLAPVASGPSYENLVDEYLGVPPPGDDYIEAIAALYRGNDKLDHRTRALVYEKAMEQV